MCPADADEDGEGTAMSTSLMEKDEEVDEKDEAADMEGERGPCGVAEGDD